jgi:hypothetical protein
MISTGADTSSAMSSTFTDLDSIKDSTKDTINGLINLGNNNAQNNNSTLGNGQAASVQQIGQSTHGSPEQGAEQLRRKSPMRSRPDLRVHIPVSSHASSVSHQNKKILS